MCAPAMEDLAVRYAPPSVRSVFIYTRETHPGENYPAHRSMEQKRRHACTFRQEHNVRRQILLDDLSGSAHRAFGSLSNMTWLIKRGGAVAFRASWTDPRSIDEAVRDYLESLEPPANVRPPYYIERLGWSRRDDQQYRKLLARSGPQAVADSTAGPATLPPETRAKVMRLLNLTPEDRAAYLDTEEFRAEFSEDEQAMIRRRLTR